jgi:hypothetical protein
MIQKSIYESVDAELVKEIVLTKKCCKQKPVFYSGGSAAESFVYPRKA